MVDASIPAQRTRPGWLPCPDWCASHDDDADAVAELAGPYDSHSQLHQSNWRCWQGFDTPRFEFRAVRHDEAFLDNTTRSTQLNIGTVDFDVRVVSLPGAAGTDGWLTCLGMREFARFLTGLAEEFDPHSLNGEPLEWHTPVRRPLLGPSPEQYRVTEKPSDSPPLQPDVEFYLGEYTW